MGIGLVSAVVAGVAGMVEAAPVPAGTIAHRRVLVHLGLVMTLLLFYAFGFILRSAVQVGQPAAPLTLAISVFGVLALRQTCCSGSTGSARSPS